MFWTIYVYLSIPQVSPIHYSLGLLGYMTACTYVTIHARLLLCLLQVWLMLAYQPNRHHLDKLVWVSPAILQSLEWWMDQDSVSAGTPFPFPFQCNSCNWRIYSRMGCSPGCLRAQGIWTLQEMRFPTNVLRTMGNLQSSPILPPHQGLFSPHTDWQYSHHLNRQGGNPVRTTVRKR